MHSQRVSFNYAEQREFWFACISDLHIFSPHHDKKLLQEDLELARERNARIFINGDWGEFILHGDKKRHNNTSNVMQTDNNLFHNITEAEKVLEPYADLIDFIGTGNHETSVQKYHNLDPTYGLIYKLHEKGHTHIRHGQYSGFIRFHYHHNDTKVRTKVMYYNHGQGGSSPVTKGTIDLSRHFGNKQCDILWVAHKHTKVVLPCENTLYMDMSDSIQRKQRIGFISGAYVKIFEVYDAMEEQGYKLDYGEQCMRGLQSTGGVFMKHTIDGAGNISMKVEV